MSLPAIPLAAGRREAPCITEPCSQCCHDIEMLLTESDVRRISAALASRAAAGKPPATESDVRRISAALAGRQAGSEPETARVDWHFQADDGYLQLRTRDGPPARGSPGGRPCVFLGEDGACTIWEARPEGCRLYPAVWDDGLRQAVLDTDYCPHTDGFALPRGATDAVRRLAARLESERRDRIG